MNVRCLKLCLVTNLQKKPFNFYRPFILKAIQGGVTSVQLREKTNNLSELRRIAIDLKSMLDRFKIPLIINDHAELSKEIDAAGIHLGQSDLSPAEARKIVGANKIIGWSVETLEELERANELTCIDYIAASAVFPSKTKPDCKMIWGLNGLQRIIALSKHPVVAIGGINRSNIRKVIESGATGIAVIGAIHDHVRPGKAAADLITEIDASINKEAIRCSRR